MAETECELRAYRATLDLRPAQVSLLTQHVNAARKAFNFALGLKVEAHQEWRRQVDALVADGTDEKAARKQVKVKIPTKPDVQKAFNAARGDDRKGVDGIWPWWHQCNTYAYQSAMADADMAWKNWLSSLSGKRAGRAVGYPRFKAKGRSRESFRLHHDVKRPTIRVATYRRLNLPTIGEVRTHDSLKRLHKAVERGGVVQSVTISRSGHRWYASVLVKSVAVEAQPTKRQRQAGAVGVDVGTKVMAALSTGELVENPGTKRQHAKAYAKASRSMSRKKPARGQRGSRRYELAKRRVGRLAHLEAERRATHLHHLTKRLATSWETVVLEDLNVAGMTRSARGTTETPGKRVRQKAGLNRSILDVSPGELRRQVIYKARWHGARVIIADRFYPSSKTCSNCGTVNGDLRLSDRMYTCDCGLTLDRDINAARNLVKLAA